MTDKKLVNPHNPEFLTKKPWYLSQEGAGSSDPEAADGAAAEPTLDHQLQQTVKEELTLSQAEQLLQQKRKKEKELKRQGKFTKGQWVEALYRGKLPYRMCKITAIHGKQLLDLEFEDGQTELKVNPHKTVSGGKTRVKHIASGSRTLNANGETYDSKRDAYHGYDAETHNKKLQAKFEEREAIRRKIREQEEEEKMKLKETNQPEKGNEKGDEDDDSFYSDLDSDQEDEYVQRDSEDKVITTRIARQGGVGGNQMKMTARNLRIREDTAKYLRNLDPESAFYDPKSRSMRDNPNPHLAPEESAFAGDNFTRMTGDALRFADTQQFAETFAWDETGTKAAVHAQANPSQAERIKKEFQSRSSELKLMKKKAVLDRYGGSEYLDGSGGLASAVSSQEGNGTKIDRNVRFGIQTKAQEYSRDGRSTGLAAQGREKLQSRYEEDIFINGHKSVWGSFFHKGAFAWGYADDHSLIKNSYGTGENGRIANDEANEMMYGTGKAGSAALAQARGMLKAIPGANSSSLSSYKNPSSLYGESDQKLSLDQQKVRDAIAKARTEKESSGNKRKYNSLDTGVDISEEDMEAYRITKDRRDDPMAKFDEGAM